MKGRRLHRWLSRIAITLLLIAVVGAGIWFGLGRPRLWQPPSSAPLIANVTPSAEPAIAPIASAITATTVPANSLPTVTPSGAPSALPVTSANTTFTSRELVTTTLAVPLAGWTNGPAQSVALSADGRWVAFTAESYITATQPPSGTAPSGAALIDSGYDDLYLYDRTQATLTRVTTSAAGAPSNGWVGAAAMAPDGRYLAFYAWASNLVAGDSNAVQDLFFYDRDAATLSRLSVAANGGQANGRSGDSSGDNAPALSADGRYIAFDSAAANLVRGDDNHNVDLFLYDRQAQTTTLISLGPGGVAGNGDSAHPAISVDGRYIAFESRATNLDPSVPLLQGPGATQIYLHDRNDGSTVLISRGPDGRPGNGDSSAPALSGDGRYLVYASAAGNLVAGDSNQTTDIFLYERSSGATRRVSVSSAGVQANRAAALPQISLDGQHIVFTAAASNLVSGDGNNLDDLFIYDQLALHTSRVSVAVTGLWTGQEANGPTHSRAALIPGGRLVAFVSQATNLAPPALRGVPGLYLHERANAPTFAISGQVLESNGQPVAGVIVAAGPHRTTTGANGNFTLSSLVGGTYTLAVAKAGYTFTPERRTISLLSTLDGQDFLAFAGGGPDAFLDLPLPYDGSAATLMALLRDTDEGGWVDAWFDHDAPNYTQNGAMLLWDGRARTQDPYNESLGCFERRCYEGHDGIDFPYRDPDPSTTVYEPILVRPAAAGAVAALVQSCTKGDRWCNGGYGNEVVLWHDLNPLPTSDGQPATGYFTRYSHLANVAVATLGQWVTPDLTLGEMGSTGNSLGTHLHFAVHHDNGNSVWDGEKVDLPVDPFGWAGLEADPWAETAPPSMAAQAPISRWLWRFDPATEAILLGSEGATLRDGAGNVTVRIPAGALAGQVRVELVAGAAVAPPANPQRTLGRAFRLQVLDWLQGGNAPNAAPARPLEVSVGFSGVALRHVDAEQILLYHWQAGAGWTPLPTIVDSQAQAVIAAGNQFGDFDLQAPLLCPADALEPDDSFDAATLLDAGDAVWERLLDIAEDEDWFQIETSAATSYQVAVTATAPTVDFTVEMYDRDGLTRLASRGPGAFTWTAAAAGIYFIRIAPAAGSPVGCTAGYRLELSLPGN